MTATTLALKLKRLGVTSAEVELYKTDHRSGVLRERYDK